MLALSPPQCQALRETACSCPSLSLHIASNRARGTYPHQFSDGWVAFPSSPMILGSRLQRFPSLTSSRAPMLGSLLRDQPSPNQCGPYTLSKTKPITECEGIPLIVKDSAHWGGRGNGKQGVRVISWPLIPDRINHYRGRNGNGWEL